MKKNFYFFDAILSQAFRESVQSLQAEKKVLTKRKKEFNMRIHSNL
jgi:hypothetical protein